MACKCTGCAAEERQRAIEAAVAEEREACADAAFEFLLRTADPSACEVADAIRARAEVR